MFWKCLLPMLKCVWKVHHKNWLFNGKRYTKKSYALNCSHKCPCALLRYLVFNQEKPFYLKQTFSTAKNETKPIADPKSTSKINMRSFWTVFQILLMSAVFAFKRFCMETRLSNILKTANATKCRKTILESTYQVVLGAYNLAAPARPIFLLRTVEYWTTFDI